MDLRAWVETNCEIREKQEDGEYTIRCPWCDGRSLRINVNKGVFFCLKCSEKGRHKKLIGKMGGEMVVLNTTRYLRDKLSGMRRTREEPQREDFGLYPEAWLAQFDTIRPHTYWRKTRGFAHETVQWFRLGYDPVRNAGTIPIRHAPTGQPMGVIRRHLDPDVQPRYLYPRGFKLSTHVWNLNGCWDAKRVAIVEGSLDAIAMHDAGIPAIALLGSRLSDAQAKLIRRSGIHEVVVCTDDDAAGEHAVDDVRTKLKGLTIRVGMYEASWDGTDPGELSPDQRRSMYFGALSLREFFMR